MNHLLYWWSRGIEKCTLLRYSAKYNIYFSYAMIGREVTLKLAKDSKRETEQLGHGKSLFMYLLSVLYLLFHNLQGLEVVFLNPCRGCIFWVQRCSRDTRISVRMSRLQQFYLYIESRRTLIQLWKSSIFIFLPILCLVQGSGFCPWSWVMASLILCMVDQILLSGWNLFLSFVCLTLMLNYRNIHFFLVSFKREANLS